MNNKQTNQLDIVSLNTNLLIRESIEREFKKFLFE